MTQSDLWKTLCALITEFPDDPRAHAVIYARLMLEDSERPMVARIVMEMIPRTPKALDELISCLAEANCPLTMQTVVASALERDPGHGPKLSLFETHNEKRYPIPAPRADWAHHDVGGAHRMGALQRCLLLHPGFRAAVVSTLRAGIGQPDQPYRRGLDNEASRAAVVWSNRVNAEIETIRILRRAIDVELAACDTRETEWIAGLKEICSDVSAEFDRMFTSVFGGVGNDAASITDFLLHTRIEHREYFAHGLEKVRDCQQKSEVRERLETFLLESRVIVTEDWVRGAPGAVGPRLRAWNALRQMLWRPGDPDRFVERVIARSAAIRERGEMDKPSEADRITEIWLELPTPRDGYGYRPLTEVLVGKQAFADFAISLSSQGPPNINRRYPDERSA